MKLDLDLGLDRGAVFTFLHVSDVHFWTEDPAREAFFRHLGLVPFLDGVLGHSIDAITALYRFHGHLEQLFPAEKLGLIVTGDLTAWGRPDQYDLANDYFAHSIPGSRPLGLRRPSWLDQAIPGNHDHWPGLTILGPSNPWLAANFSTPFLRDLPLSTGHVLRFIGFDSDRDVSAVSIDRFLALGSFRSEVKTTDQQLGQMPAAIPILLVHHSAQVTGLALRIRGGSMRSLMSLLSAHRIPVMLTGHAHSTCIVPINFPTHTTLEARCGTTTQIDILNAELTGRLPLGTQVTVRRQKERDRNALLVHQVVKVDKRLEWVTRDYVRTPLEFERGAITRAVRLT